MIAYIRKALIAAGFGFAGALGTAMLDGNLTASEAIAALGIGIGAGAATYAAKNGDRPARRRRNG